MKRAINNLTKAGQALGVARSYAEDGAVQSAIDRITEALELLYLERQRREAIGLMKRAERKSILFTSKAVSALQKMIEYDWCDELEDYQLAECRDGHVFESIVFLDNLVKGSTATPASYLIKK